MPSADRRIVQLGKLNILLHIFGGIAGIMVMFSLANFQSIALPVTSFSDSKPSLGALKIVKETKRPDQKTPFSLIKTLQVASLPRQFFFNLQAVRPSFLPWINPVFISVSFTLLSFFLLPFLPEIKFRLLSCECPRGPPRKELVFF